MPETRTLWVKAHPSQGERLALWDRDPNHPKQEGQPKGEIFVAGQRSAPVEVAETPGVLDALNPPAQGQAPRLIRLEGRALDQARKVAEEEAEAVEERRDAARAEQAEAAQTQANTLRALGLAPPMMRERDGGDGEDDAETARLRDLVDRLEERDRAREADFTRLQADLEAAIQESRTVTATATAANTANASGASGEGQGAGAPPPPPASTPPATGAAKTASKTAGGQGGGA